MLKDVWLKWDGIYNTAGICNKPPIPFEENEVKAIKQRLTLLGFDCGELDEELNDETKIALLTFNGYC